MRTKKSLRRQMRALLLAQSTEERDAKSWLIQEKLFKTPAFQSAGTVLFFVSLPMEVNTHPMIIQTLGMGKRVLVPKVDSENKELKLKEIRDFGKDLVPGTLGILEPVSKTKSADVREVECLVAPGLAFDAKGCRLGQGGGFYDRLLETLPPQVPTIGLAFSFQVISQIPLEKHDKAVRIVLTEK